MLLSVNKTIFQFENDGCFSCPCFVHCVIVINIDKFYITSMNLSIYTQCTFAYAFYMVYYFKWIRYETRNRLATCQLNRKYDACSCLRQSENIKSKVLSVSLWVFMTRRAIKTHPRCQLVYLYQTIPKVWLWKMVVGHILSWADFSRILFQRATRGSRMFSKMADILTEVLHLCNRYRTCFFPQSVLLQP